MSFLETETNGRRGCAFDTIGGATAWTYHRHQRFIALTTCRPIGLDNSEDGARGACVASVTFFPLIATVAGSALWTLRTLRTGLPLNTRNALNALRTLRPGGALRSRVAFRPGISPTAGKNKRSAQ